MFSRGSKHNLQPDDLKKIRVYPLAKRESLSPLNKILVNPDGPAPSIEVSVLKAIQRCAQRVHAARAADASVILMYGAHLVKNGALGIVNRLVAQGSVTHVATNGAGVIHDWELAFLGWTEESVRKNVATGTFGMWDETGRWAQLALLAGALRGEGYGRSMGRLIWEGGVELPDAESLRRSLRDEPTHPFAPARAEMLQAASIHQLPAGKISLKHPWKGTSILGQSFNLGVPATVHPGIGYDIISNHPMFNGAVIGRAAEIDFRLLGSAIDQLDGGVVLSIGSAIMAPQVFEKSVSCVNNLRLQSGRKILRDHTIFVVDIQDGSNWDWSKGEPPKDNPAYYLRFCKSFSRMGGEMHYVQCDNVAFLHNFLQELKAV
jgi:hypothetical protein